MVKGEKNEEEDEAENDVAKGCDGVQREGGASRPGGEKEEEEAEPVWCQMVCGRTTKVSPSQTLWLSKGMLR